MLVMILSHIILDDRMTLIKLLCCIGYIIGVICIFQLIESILFGDLVSYLYSLFIIIIHKLEISEYYHGNKSLVFISNWAFDYVI